MSTNTESKKNNKKWLLLLLLLLIASSVVIFFVFFNKNNKNEKDIYDKLGDKLGKNKVKMIGEDILLDLNEDMVYFDLNSAELKEKSFESLNKIAEIIKEYPEYKVRIEGHTDSSGKYDYNIMLSENRAKSVLEYLVKQGVKKDRLYFKGFGPDKPIASNENEEGMAKNRRVEIILSKKNNLSD